MGDGVALAVIFETEGTVRRLGPEYDGRGHLTPERARRDLVREGYLGRSGWEVVRFGWAEVCHRPDLVAARVRSKIAAAATRGWGSER